ncbi:MAG: transcription termination/antitermination protein NusG [Acidobacteriota bacterium]
MPEEYLGPEEGESTPLVTADEPFEEAPEEPAVSAAAEEAEAEPEPAEEVAEEVTVEAPAEPAAEAAPLSPDAAAAALHPNMSWYIIHTYSGFEQKVRESLRTRAQAFGFSDQLGEILIPTEEVVEMRNGKKVTSKRLLYPGYVLLQLEMSENLWHAVKETPRVTGFVGGGKDPVPLTADEVNSVLYRQTSSAERPRPKLSFDKGETVRITEGPFANFSGRVDEVNTERDTLRVLVTIFGRSTPVELDFLQVEKLN